MIINVKVKPKSKHQSVVETADGVEVSVHASPEDGKANEEVVELLADHYEAAKSSVEIVQGHTSRNKVVEIRMWQKR